MKISVLGGGFGIYGYLPAACSLGWEVATLSRYSTAIQERPELSNYYQSLQYRQTESDLLSSGSAIVFAKKPRLQFEFLMENLKSNSKLTHLFLEKPLADSISNSQLVLDLLKTNGISFSVGYLFQYTDWFKDLESICESEGNHIIINWRIPSTNSDWKNSQVAGGGLYSFFLIHFVPILTRLGFLISDLDIDSRNEKCTLRIEGSNYIEINAEIVSENFHFEILANHRIESVFNAQTPFGSKPMKATPDPRIISLKKYLVSASDGSNSLNCSIETEHNVIKFLNLCAEANSN